MNTEKIKNLYYAVIDMTGEKATFAQRIDSFDELLNEALKRIPDNDLRLEIDELIGALALNSEYKGFELGMESRRICEGA